MFRPLPNAPWLLDSRLEVRSRPLGIRHESSREGVAA